MGADEREGAPRRPLARGGWQIARVRGVPIRITTSWIIFSVFIVVLYGSYRDTRGNLDAYALGVSVVVCLLVSVLLHEVGHAVVARRYRVRVRGITLELLGGYTEMDAEAPSPRAEAAIALAGPAVSLVLAGAASAAVPFLARGSLGGDVAFQMAATNIIVTVFNVLPGLPLDGGRAVRAGIWRLTGSQYRADVIAGWAGRGLAIATVLAGIVLFIWSPVLTLLSVVFVALIGGTLWSGASAAIEAARWRERVPRIRARDLSRPLHLVPSGTPLSEALRQQAERAAACDGGVGLAVGDAAGRVVALVDPGAVAGVPVDGRPWVPVDSVARSVRAGQRIGIDAAGTDVLRAVHDHPGEDLLVTVGEDVVGVLRVRDVLTALTSRGPAR